MSTGCESVCSCMFLYIYIQLQAFLTCVGYVLCFAPVLTKMLRVAYIFRNPTHKKKVSSHSGSDSGRSSSTSSILVVVQGEN